MEDLNFHILRPPISTKITKINPIQLNNNKVLDRITILDRQGKNLLWVHLLLQKLIRLEIV